jgi:RND family efflux transporter MFP subunit
MNRRIRWALVALALVLVGAALGRALLSSKAEEAPAARASVPVALELAASDVAVAQRRELVRQLDITGELRAVDSAVVKARVAAEVQELGVREGDAVRAGQVLGRLDASEYRLKLRQSEQQAAQAKAQLDIAERALESNRSLVERGFISRNALDTSVSNAAAARAALQAARAAADLSRKAEADTVLRAPIAGLVAQRLVQPGERVPVDARLIEIVDLSRLEIEAAVAPEEVGRVRVGATAELRVDGITGPVRARVARINPTAQPGTRSVLVYLDVEPQAGLRQGLFATGRLAVERKTALAVPQDAVRIDQSRPRVLEVADGRVFERIVDLGLRGSAAQEGEPLVEVTAGLAEGATLLRASVGAVREGTAVRLSSAGGVVDAGAGKAAPVAVSAASAAKH